MNEQIERCLYQAGLTAQGCWDELDDYARQGIEKFAEMIIKKCMSEINVVKQIKVGHANPTYTQGFEDGMFVAIRTIEDYFGIEEWH